MPAGEGRADEDVDVECVAAAGARAAEEALLPSGEEPAEGEVVDPADVDAADGCTGDGAVEHAGVGEDGLGVLQEKWQVCRLLLMVVLRVRPQRSEFVEDLH